MSTKMNHAYDGLSQIDFDQMSNGELAKAYDVIAGLTDEQDSTMATWRMVNRAMDSREGVNWESFAMFGGTV